MTAAGEQPAGAVPVQPARGLTYRLSVIAKCVVATGLALTPFTAFLVLGWLTRLMRREAVIARIQTGRQMSRADALGAMQTDAALSVLARFPGWWSGLWATVVGGLRATLAIAASSAACRDS